MTIECVRQVMRNAEEIDPPPPPVEPGGFTEAELDEILTHRWPSVLRRTMAESTDDWLKGFVRSIARHGKRRTWRPTARQHQIMRQLLLELGTASDGEVQMIER